MRSVSPSVTCILLRARVGSEAVNRARSEVRFRRASIRTARGRCAARGRTEPDERRAAAPPRARDAGFSEVRRTVVPRSLPTKYLDFKLLTLERLQAR